jgi:hypothetical protein
MTSKAAFVAKLKEEKEERGSERLQRVNAWTNSIGAWPDSSQIPRLANIDF